MSSTDKKSIAEKQENVSLNHVEWYYNTLAEDPNNFSFWFPKVNDCGIKVPESRVVPVPMELLPYFYLDSIEDDSERIAQWVKTDVMPVVMELKHPLIFVKNGTFSNKFNFADCAVPSSYYRLVDSIISIQYMSACFGAGGLTEIVLRERIVPNAERLTFRIYHGMPLVPEFRVFYDFDRKKPLYVANYWDWSYCYGSIAVDQTDRLVYEAAYPGIHSEFEELKDDVMKLVAEHMACVQGLDGVWSVDLMFADHEFWLIDMAVGARSAYYDPDKIKAAQEEKE